MEALQDKSVVIALGNSFRQTVLVGDRTLPCLTGVKLLEECSRVGVQDARRSVRVRPV